MTNEFQYLESETTFVIQPRTSTNPEPNYHATTDKKRLINKKSKSVDIESQGGPS